MQLISNSNLSFIKIMTTEVYVLNFIFIGQDFLLSDFCFNNTSNQSNHHIFIYSGYLVFIELLNADLFVIAIAKSPKASYFVT